MDDRNLIYAVLAISVISLVANGFVMLEIGKEGPEPASPPANAVSGCKRLCSEFNLGSSCVIKCRSIALDATNACHGRVDPRGRAGCSMCRKVWSYDDTGY